MTDLRAERSSEVAKRNPSGDEQPLFRSEALAERTQWLGTVLLAPRVSHRLFAAFAILSMSGVLALLYFSEYTRKERINGWLVPEHGLVRVIAPQRGVITNLYVQEGDEVIKGTPLLALSTEAGGSSCGTTS